MILRRSDDDHGFSLSTRVGQDADGDFRWPAGPGGVSAQPRRSRLASPARHDRSERGVEAAHARKNDHRRARRSRSFRPLDPEPLGDGPILFLAAQGWYLWAVPNVRSQLHLKGISTIPTFTLGKPAVIFDMSMGKRNLRFEPQFRFALEGKPWTFLFWWRYKLLTTDKFLITLGTHPAIAFRNRFFSTNGVSREIIVAQRYLAGELTPNYVLAKNISIGMYYLYSYGVEKDVTKNTHYLALRSSFSNLKLSHQYFMGFTPQFYYLKLDKQDGLYFSSTLTLAKRNFPLSISSIVTKSIQTDILASQNFLWNVTFIYSFR